MQLQQHLVLAIAFFAAACGTEARVVPDVAGADTVALEDAAADADLPPDGAATDLSDSDTAETVDVVVQPLCTPGAQSCASVTTTQVCDETGFGYQEPEVCPVGNRCTLGVCAPSCPTDPMFGAYAGCQFWATDLPNYPDTSVNPTPENAPWAIVVSNPGQTDVTVAFELPPLLTWAPADAVVPPGQSVVFEPPNINVQGTSQGAFGVHLLATGPVLAHQFNPWDIGYSNDATALLPDTLLGLEHVVLSWPTEAFDAGQPIGTPTPANKNGYLTVIAAYDDTRVTFRTAAPVRNATGFVGMNGGQSRTVTLQRGEALSVQGDPGRFVEVADMTGSLVSADKPVAVFGGHEQALVGDQRFQEPGTPASEKPLCCADHLEAQMLPTTLLGTTYFAIKSPPRGTTTVEPDFWRIQAAEDGVTITTDPPQGGASNRVLAKQGDFIQVKTNTSFQVKASGLAQVGQYLVSQDATEEAIGDPGLMVLVPAGKFRRDYAFMLPDNGYRSLWASIVRETGDPITIDGSPVAADFTPVGATGWEYAWVEVPAGVHVASASKRFGLNLYGYGKAVSFCFAAGIAGPRE